MTSLFLLMPATLLRRPRIWNRSASVVLVHLQAFQSALNGDERLLCILRIMWSSAAADIQAVVHRRVSYT